MVNSLRLSERPYKPKTRIFEYFLLGTSTLFNRITQSQLIRCILGVACSVTLPIYTCVGALELRKVEELYG